MRVLVTGATGFVGRHLIARLQRDPEYAVRAVSRRDHPLLERTDWVRIDDIADHRDWSEAVLGCDAVVHAAARVHVLNEQDADPLRAFRRANVEATERLARQAVAGGARRFVFLSSVKVLGDSTRPSRPFSAFDTPRPHGPYAVSKHEAEEALRCVAEETGLEVVVIRPVLVYGPGVGANFLSMMRALEKGWPLPFGAVRNRRSLVAVDNLSDLVVRCLTNTNAPGQSFMVSDGEDLSTPELLTRLANAMQVEARLYSLPTPLLRAGAQLLRREDHASRLLDSLQVDIAHTRETLQWKPRISVDQALERTAADYWNHDANPSRR